MSKERTRVYTWEFPVRFTHWINFLCIFTLSITGYYIGDPFIHALSSKQYIMGWVRFIHFTAAYAFLMSMIIRLYWAFAGNQYASFRAWFPFTGKRVGDLIGTLKFYLFLSKKPPFTVGHSALAGFTYLFIFALFIFQIISGFAMYSVVQKGSIMMMLGGWLTGSMDLQTIRLYHHVGMYIIMAFVLVHVYVGWFLDIKERNGLMSSIFGGYKFMDSKEMK